MPKQSARAEVNTFVRGLITEASPLNFPPNASLDEQNYELNRDGTRDRRLGLDYEEDSVLIPTSLSIDAFIAANPIAFKWTEVRGDSQLNFVVVQSGQDLYFFDMGFESLSSQGFKGTLNLDQFPPNTRYSMTSLEGLLVLVAGVDRIAVVEYDETNFSVSYDAIQVRDVWGIEVDT